MTDSIEFGGLSCEVNLPLEWLPLSGQTGLSPSVEHANQNCLKIVLGLDEAVHEPADESAELSQDLQRVEFKVNIILELVGQLISQNKPTPTNVDITLGPKALRWLAVSNPPEIGQTLQTKIYLDTRFPFPYVISGCVTSVTQVEAGYLVVVDAVQTNPHSLGLLEKYIFRCHRRQIARMKSETAT